MNSKALSLRAALALSFGLALPAQAAVEIQWWHAMTGPLNDKVNALAAYQQALTASGDKANPELQMKLDELAPPDAAAKEVKTNA